MRLVRLDLTRYGKFTDEKLEFGPAKKGMPDLHLVYGPNEAGKSTALAAYLDVLFGIGKISPYNYIHAYSSMEIGAALEIESVTHEVIRLKRSSNSLVDKGYNRISNQVLHDALAGMDRNAYCLLYSLDDDSIEEGGDSILANQGDIGEMLYSASAGIVDLGTKLSEIRQSGSEFFRARSTTDKLSELKNELKALKGQKDALDIIAPRYKELVISRDTAHAGYQDTVAELGQLKTRMGEIQRLIRALPRYIELRSIRDELTPLQDLPEAPDNWIQQLPELQKTETSLVTRRDALTEDTHSIESALKAVSVDKAAWEQRDCLDHLEGLRSRCLDAQDEMPGRKRELSRLDDDIARLLQQLDRDGEADPVSLVPPASQAASLAAHAKQSGAVNAELEIANKEYLAAEQELREAEAELAAHGAPSSGDAEDKEQNVPLRLLVEEAHDSDADTRLSMATESQARLHNELTANLQALSPWTGNLEQLATLSVPDPGDIQALRNALEQASSRVSDCNKNCEQLEEECQRFRAETSAITRVDGVVTEQQAADIRQQRDAAWERHRAQLNADSATSFKQLLDQDDAVSAARLACSNEFANLAQSSKSLALSEAGLAHAVKSREAANAALAEEQKRLTAMFRLFGAKPPDTPSLDFLSRWMDRRALALQTGQALADAESGVQQASEELDALGKKLRAALGSAGGACSADTTFGTLVKLAQRHMDREAELSNYRVIVEQKQQGLQQRLLQREQAEQAQGEWQSEWDRLCAACWFGGADKSPAVEPVLEILGLTDKLERAIAERKRGQGELEDCLADQAAFRQEVCKLAAQMDTVADSDISDVDVAELHLELRNRIRQAVSNHEKQQQKQAELDNKKTAARALAEQIEINNKQSQEMFAYLGVQSLISVDERLRKIADRQKLQARERSMRQELFDTLLLATDAEVEDALSSISPSELEEEHARLEATLNDLDARRAEQQLSWSKADDQLKAVGGDEAVARITEQYQTLLLDIEDKAMAYLKQSAGIMAIEEALRAYRDRHQSSMMQQASRAFKSMTAGRYTKLATRPDKDADILIGITPEGRSRLSTEMSKGTRFQLYLALRVAGYHEYARERTPVPFITDDIMETFDNERAQETFRQFADMAMTGQVIYLTHHEHLCDIARQVCPTVKIHQLG